MTITPIRSPAGFMSIVPCEHRDCQRLASVTSKVFSSAVEPESVFRTYNWKRSAFQALDLTAEEELVVEGLLNSNYGIILAEAKQSNHTIEYKIENGYCLYVSPSKNCYLRDKKSLSGCPPVYTAVCLNSGQKLVMSLMAPLEKYFIKALSERGIAAKLIDTLSLLKYDSDLVLVECLDRSVKDLLSSDSLKLENVLSLLRQWAFIHCTYAALGIHIQDNHDENYMVNYLSNGQFKLYRIDLKDVRFLKSTIPGDVRKMVTLDPETIFDANSNTQALWESNENLDQSFACETCESHLTHAPSTWLTASSKLNPPIDEVLSGLLEVNVVDNNYLAQEQVESIRAFVDSVTKSSTSNLDGTTIVYSVPLVEIARRILQILNSSVENDIQSSPRRPKRQSFKKPRYNPYPLPDSARFAAIVSSKNVLKRSYG